MTFLVVHWIALKSEIKREKNKASKDERATLGLEYIKHKAK